MKLTSLCSRQRLKVQYPFSNDIYFTFLKGNAMQVVIKDWFALKSSVSIYKYNKII
jgi:hypothetical protein